MDQNQLKRLAAEKAVEEIQSGMVVGLGSGSTIQFALERIGEKIKNKELTNIIGIPSSVNTEREAVRLGIPLTTLNAECGMQNVEFTAKEKNVRKIKDLHSALSTQHSAFVIDLAIDGADEADENLNLIKGGGGALLREKVIAQASKRFIIMLDESKLSKYLGEKFYVPVEVLEYALEVENNFLRSLGAETTIRKNDDGSNYKTDENNILIHAKFNAITDPDKLMRELEQRAGIVEHGLFPSKLVEKIICAGNDGIKEIYNGSVQV